MAILDRRVTSWSLSCDSVNERDRRARQARGASAALPPGDRAHLAASTFVRPGIFSVPSDPATAMASLWPARLSP